MTLPSWRTMPVGGAVFEPGNSRGIETGSWRVARPVIDFSRCSHCMICWLFCPDSCFRVENSRLIGLDLDHCKGCGICVVECPKECIALVEESKVGQEAR